MRAYDRRQFLSGTLASLGAVALVTVGGSRLDSNSSADTELLDKLPDGFSYAPGPPPPKPNAFYDAVVTAVGENQIQVRIGAEKLVISTSEPSIWKMGVV